LVYIARTARCSGIDSENRKEIRQLEEAETPISHAKIESRPPTHPAAGVRMGGHMDMSILGAIAGGMEHGNLAKLDDSGPRW